MTPTVGRIVHYRDFNGETRAALVVFVDYDGTPNLRVFDPTGTADGIRFSVNHDPEALRSNTWRFPPRVEP